MCAKWRMACLLLLTLLLAGSLCCAAENGSLYTIQDLVLQADAIGGRWTKTYDAHGRTIEVDCAVIVPDVKRLPVLEIERLRPSRERFDAILASAQMVRPKNPKFLLVPEGGETLEGTGMSDTQTIRFATNGAGLTAQYDCCQDVWIQQGEYEMIGQNGPMKGYVIVEESAYAWERPQDTPLADGNAHTVEDCTEFLRGWMETFYPGENLRVQPVFVSAFSPRRVRGMKAGGAAQQTGADAPEGYYVITYEQLLGGVPLFQTIADYELTHIAPDTPQKLAAANRLEEKLRPMIQGARDAANKELKLRFRNEKWHYTFLQFAAVRNERISDVPLAPLGDVIAAIEAEIAAGRIRKVTALRLGYVIYPDPQAGGLAWAVPQWIADCEYFESAKAEKKTFRHEESGAFFHEWEFASVPIDAQTARVIAYDEPSGEIYAAPQILTWEDTRHGE